MALTRGTYLFLVAVTAIPCGAATYLVAPDGSGDFPTIQAALDEVVAGDTVALADGIFTGEGNRDLDYHGKAVTLRSQSGNAAACWIDCQADTLDQHRGVRFASSESSAAELIGVTITGGCVVDLPENMGGAVFCTAGASPTLAGCRFVGCRAGGGGGVGCTDDARPRIVDCLFEGNAVGHIGGGLFCTRASGASLSHCRFIANFSPVYGGAVAGNGSSFELTDCLFQDNVAGVVGGGIMAEIDCALELSRCVFLGNSAGEMGGGPSFEDGCTARLSDCTLAGNEAQTGGGIFCWISAVSLERCTFFGNSAHGSSGAAIHCWPGSQVTMTHSIVGYSTRGVGIDCDELSDVDLSCCDIFGNANGDWVGCLAGQNGIDGNFAADPIFCEPQAGDFHLHSDSPCAGINNPGCGQLGAWPIGCGDVSQAEPAQAEFAGLDCVPNPFWASTRLSFRIAGEGEGEAFVLHIYDVSGRLVRSFTAGGGAPGLRSFVWDGADRSGARLAAGLYFCRLSQGGRELATAKALLLR